MGLNDLAALGMALQESDLLGYEQAWTMPKILTPRVGNAR